MRAVCQLLSLIALTTLANPMCSAATDAEHGVGWLGSQLAQMERYSGQADFEVLLPSARDPIEYAIALQSRTAQQPDTLAPCQYLIEWQASTKSGPASGFSAYFDGNHYRFRSNRLQEYHFTDKPEPFAPSGRGAAAGVQMQAQFADLLPQFIGAHLQQLAADTASIVVFHPDTLVSGRKAVAVDGVKRRMGYDAQIFSYAFDRNTLEPICLEITTSPGAISEQTVTVAYRPAAPDARMAEMTEADLIARWPEAFEKFRESQFRAENLVGQPLPEFSCPQLGGDRYTRHRLDPLPAPTIFVVIDPQVASAERTVQAVREAAEQLPAAVDVVWAVNSNHSADIADLLGELAPGETALTSAGSLVRNCGITLYPTIIMADSSGTVKEVLLGYNNGLSSVVIQKAALLR